MFGSITLLQAIKLVSALIALAGAFYMGKVWEQSTWQAKELKYLAQIEDQKKQADKVAYEYENERARLAAQQREIIREVYVEISKPDYSCQLPADGLRIINKAVTAANAGKPSDAMPTNTGSKR
jgi:uncharacterized protein HemX